MGVSERNGVKRKHGDSLIYLMNLDMSGVNGMRTLIVEDDLASRKFLSKFLSRYGECDMTVDGLEAVEAFLMAWDEEKPYDLICLDIMLPKMDGLKVLRLIRDLEKQKSIPSDRRVKIFITTALNQTEEVFNAFEGGCEVYAAKPIDIKKMTEVMQKLRLIPETG